MSEISAINFILFYYWGDSGGMIMVDINTSETEHEYVQVGVVSGNPISAVKLPAVYFDVSKYKSWINNHGNFGVHNSCLWF